MDPHAGHVFGHTVFAITAVLTPEAEPIATSADTPEVQPASLAVTLTAAGLAVAGVASMIYEVAWTRALSLVIGSSTSRPCGWPSCWAWRSAARSSRVSSGAARALAVDPAHAGAAQLRGEINAKLYGGKTP